MKKITTFLLLTLVSSVITVAFASSPFSSTKFYSAYMSDEIVQLAEQQGFLDGRITLYLIDDANDIGVKMAVINAFNWNEKGNINVDTYKMFMGRKYHKNYENLDYTEMSGTELACLGYMMLLNPTGKLTDAIDVLTRARERSENSFTINLIYNMAVAQASINDAKECEAYTVINGLRSQTSFVQDMDASAVNVIYEAIDPYQSNCN